MLRVRGAALTTTAFREKWLTLRHFYELTLKFSIFPKLRPSSRLQSQQNCEFFAHCAPRRMWQMPCICVPGIDVSGSYRRTRRRLRALRARSRLSTAGGSLRASWPRRSAAAPGKSLQRGTAAPLSSPSSFRVWRRERASPWRGRVKGVGVVGGRRLKRLKVRRRLFYFILHSFSHSGISTHNTSY